MKNNFRLLRAFIILFPAILVFVYLLIISHSDQTKSTHKSLTYIIGTKTQGGTYYDHKWNNSCLKLDVLAPTGDVYEFQVSIGTDIVLQDQIKHTRTEMSPSQLSAWLDVNNSETLCTVVGVNKGKVDNLIILVPGID